MTLSHLACRPEESRGREFTVEQGGVRGPRSAFQRDRDRIIHSIAFRRLRHKTQVFVAPDGDHYRTRMTHSLECAQIGRVIARTLGLNEDLTEALCLAHDIGHPPFGHAGEAALEEAMTDFGGFDHNENTLRILMRLETPYPLHDGLNLSWEVLEGLAKHNGPVAMPRWALRALDAAYPLDLMNWPSLEAQVAAVADDIAYDNHDIDDGLRAGFLDLEQLLTLDLIADQWREIERRFPYAPRDRLQRELVRTQIGTMVNDVIEQTRHAVRESGVATADEVRLADRQLGGFSSSFAVDERKLKKFMYANLYEHPEQVETARRAENLIRKLLVCYQSQPEAMTGDWLAQLPSTEPSRSRHISDYVAGMTDRFAMVAYERLIGKPVKGLQNV